MVPDLPVNDYLSVAEQPRSVIVGDRQFQTDATTIAQTYPVIDLATVVGVRITSLFWADAGLALEFQSNEDRALYSLAYEGVRD
jgi:hypothetical protein